MNPRVPRVITSVSLAPLSVASGAVAQNSAGVTSGDASGRSCLYRSLAGDAPEIGPLPCDLSRPYTIGIWGGDAVDAVANEPADEELPPSLAVEWSVGRDGRGRPALQGEVLAASYRITVEGR